MHRFIPPGIAVVKSQTYLRTDPRITITQQLSRIHNLIFVPHHEAWISQLRESRRRCANITLNLCRAEATVAGRRFLKINTSCLYTCECRLYLGDGELRGGSGRWRVKADSPRWEEGRLCGADVTSIVFPPIILSKLIYDRLFGHGGQWRCQCACVRACVRVRAAPGTP